METQAGSGGVIACGAMSDYGALASPRNVPARSADRTIADPPTGIGGGSLCPISDRLSLGEKRILSYIPTEPSGEGVGIDRSAVFAGAGGSRKLRHYWVSATCDVVRLRRRD